MKNNENYKCFDCPIEFIFKGYTIISPKKTLDEIIINKKSISRFGDGEFKLIFGESIHFQKTNKNLSSKLINVLQSNEKDLLIGINLPFKKKYVENYNDNFKKSWIQWFNKYKFHIAKILIKKKYYSSNISRFYLIYKDKTNVSKFIKKIKMIWENRDIIIIEGVFTKFGTRNDLLDNAKSIKRIICPSSNAFSIYNKIINRVKQFNKYNLLLLSLGPTATVLAYDLFKLGYQVIDVGHMDYEFNIFLNNKYRSKNKSITELNILQKISNKKYNSQILDKILY